MLSTFTSKKESGSFAERNADFRARSLPRHRLGGLESTPQNHSNARVNATVRFRKGDGKAARRCNEISRKEPKSS